MEDNFRHSVKNVKKDIDTFRDEPELPRSGQKIPKATQNQK